MQMSAEFPGHRPAVLSRATRECLEEYRAFRHLVRSVYASSLRPQRLEELAEALPGCFERVTRDLATFSAFLTGDVSSQEGPSTLPG